LLTSSPLSFNKGPTEFLTELFFYQVCIAYNVNSTAAFTYLIFFHIQVFCKQENILGLYMWCVNFVADLCEIKTNFRYVEVGTSNRTKTNDMEYAKSKLNCRNW